MNTTTKYGIQSIVSWNPLFEIVDWKYRWGLAQLSCSSVTHEFKCIPFGTAIVTSHDGQRFYGCYDQSGHRKGIGLIQQPAAQAMGNNHDSCCVDQRNSSRYEYEYLCNWTKHGLRNGLYLSRNYYNDLENSKNVVYSMATLKNGVYKKKLSIGTDRKNLTFEVQHFTQYQAMPV